MLVLWIAISLAAVFVCVVIYDSSRRKRKRTRLGGSRSRHSAGGSNPVTGYFKRLRALYRSLNEEMVKRQRQGDRNRHRHK